MNRSQLLYKQPTACSPGHNDATEKYDTKEAQPSNYTLGRSHSPQFIGNRRFLRNTNELDFLLRDTDAETKIKVQHNIDWVCSCAYQDACQDGTMLDGKRAKKTVPHLQRLACLRPPENGDDAGARDWELECQTKIILFPV